jgi:hypothetical protein
MIDENINDEDFIVTVLNDFQDDIAEKLTPVGATNINATANVWADLPEDLIALHIDEGGNCGVSKNGVTVKVFEFRELYPKRQIKFYETGTYEVQYDRAPTEITDVEESPDTHPYLHSLAVLFLASRYKSMDDDENQDALRLMQEYEQKKKKRIGILMHPSGDSGRVTVE